MYDEELTHENLKVWEKQIEREIANHEFLMGGLKDILAHVKSLRWLIAPPFDPDRKKD